MTHHMEGVVAFAEHCSLSEYFQNICPKANSRSGHSSPGNLHLEQVLSYGFRQIPQTSSSGMSQRQAATAFHSRIVTFMVLCCGLARGHGARRGRWDGQQTRVVLGRQNSVGESGQANSGSELSHAADSTWRGMTRERASLTP